MNVSHPMSVIHSYPIKNIFYDKMDFFYDKIDLRLFYFDVAIYSNDNHLDKFCFKVYCVKNLKESLLLFQINL